MNWKKIEISLNEGYSTLTNLRCFLIISFVIHVTWHAEIGHFGNTVVGQQNIPGSQITVKDLYRYKRFILFNVSVTNLAICWYFSTSQIVHASSNLETPRNQIRCRHGDDRIDVSIGVLLVSPERLWLFWTFTCFTCERSDKCLAIKYLYRNKPDDSEELFSTCDSSTGCSNSLLRGQGQMTRFS